MKIRNKFLSGVLLGTMVFSLAACGGPEEAKPTATPNQMEIVEPESSMIPDVESKEDNIPQDWQKVVVCADEIFAVETGYKTWTLFSIHGDKIKDIENCTGVSPSISNHIINVNMEDEIRSYVDLEGNPISELKGSLINLIDRLNSKYDVTGNPPYHLIDIKKEIVSDAGFTYQYQVFRDDTMELVFEDDMGSNPSAYIYPEVFFDGKQYILCEAIDKNESIYEADNQKLTAFIGGKPVEPQINTMTYNPEPQYTADLASLDMNKKYGAIEKEWKSYDDKTIDLGTNHVILEYPDKENEYAFILLDSRTLQPISDKIYQDYIDLEGNGFIAMLENELDFYNKDAKLVKSLNGRINVCIPNFDGNKVIFILSGKNYDDFLIVLDNDTGEVLFRESNYRNPGYINEECIIAYNEGNDSSTYFFKNGTYMENMEYVNLYGEHFIMTRSKEEPNYLKILNSEDGELLSEFHALTPANF